MEFLCTWEDLWNNIIYGRYVSDYSPLNTVVVGFPVAYVCWRGMILRLEMMITWLDKNKKASHCNLVALEKDLQDFSKALD